MARENQGLQIGLIVFVMLTIVFAVLTFVFSKEYNKQKVLAADAETKAAEANTGLQQAEAENMRLKTIVGFSDTATLQTIDEAYNADKEKFARNYNATDATYRQMCQWLFDDVQSKNASLSAEKSRVQQVKDQNASLEAAKEHQINELEARATKAETEKTQALVAFRDAQTKLNALNTQLRQENKKVTDAKQTVVAEAEAAQAKYVEDGKTKDALISTLYEKIDKLDPIQVDHPDGLVTYAGRGNTVSINLGRADGLRRLTNFAVYAADMTDVTTAGRKGAIEVIDVDDHSAVCQIVDEDVRNPILAGDKIFTPLWKPGQQEHFALTGGMDLDGDGRSDLDEIRNLIATNGGIVDFYLDDDGNKYGQITTETRHLVMGTAPDESSSPEHLAARKWILEEGRKFNLRQISLEELLNRMGYRRKVHVVRYDSKANPADFRAQPPEGLPKVSQGRVSDVFEKRAPPKPTIDSAY